MSLVPIVHSIQTHIDYTRRDPKHQNGKPYSIRYDTDGSIPQTNIGSTHQAVTVKDFRPFQHPSNFERYGFSVEHMGIVITEAVFRDQEGIKESYYPVIEHLLQEKYPEASHVRVLEHNLRRRHPKFPTLPENTPAEFSQPATRAHIDLSLDAAKRNAGAIFNTPAHQIKRVVAVNLWKSLQSGNDWPLALCDARSINHGFETIIVDIAYHNRFTENEYVYFSPNHQWYYVSDIVEDEIIMFLQKDTAISGGGGVPHASFENVHVAADAETRISVEFRAYVMFT